MSQSQSITLYIPTQIPDVLQEKTKVMEECDYMETGIGLNNEALNWRR